MKRTSIRHRFVRDLSAILLISTIVLSAVIAVNEGRMLNRTLASKGMKLASFIAKLSKDPLIMKDGVQLDSIVSDANKDRDMLYAVIRDAYGNIMTSQFTSLNFRSAQLKTTVARLPRESELDVILDAIDKQGTATVCSVPILSGVDTIGEVTIALSRHAVMLQVRNMLLFIIAINAIAAVVLGYVVYSASGKIIFGPLAELAGATRRLANGDLGARITLQAADELRELFETFNRMAGDLDATTVSKAYMDDIIEGMINTLIVIDRGGTIMRANAAACSLLGYHEEELQGAPIAMIISEDADALLERIRNGSGQGMSESHYRARDGHLIPMLLSISVLSDKTMNRQGAVFIAQDYTDRKRAEEAILRKTEALERSNRELEQFTNAASHDLREPARQISNFAELLASRYKERLDEDGQRYLTYVLENSARMRNQLRDLLTYSQLSRPTDITGEVDLNATLERVVVDMEPELTEAGARVTHDRLPALTVDPEHASELLRHLLNNAVKFRRAEPPRVHVSATDHPTEWTLSVRDNGIGIEPEYYDKIFVMFQRLHARASYAGTGIGLTICKKIMEQYGGRIWVESEPGVGSVFHCAFPKKTDTEAL